MRPAVVARIPPPDTRSSSMDSPTATPMWMSIHSATRSGTPGRLEPQRQGGLEVALLGHPAGELHRRASDRAAAQCGGPRLLLLRRPAGERVERQPAAHATLALRGPVDRADRADEQDQQTEEQRAEGDGQRGLGHPGRRLARLDRDRPEVLVSLRGRGRDEGREGGVAQLCSARGRGHRDVPRLAGDRRREGRRHLELVGDDLGGAGERRGELVGRAGRDDASRRRRRPAASAAGPGCCQCRRRTPRPA